MSLRLSHHVNGLKAETKTMLASNPGGGLLVLDSAADIGFLTEYRAANPDADILFRATFPDEQSLDDWQWKVDTLCNRADPIRHLLTGILTPWCEARQDSLADMREYGQKTGFAAMQLHDRGYTNVIGGSFSTTKPNLLWWTAWLEAGGWLCNAYALHEYARSALDLGGQYWYRMVWAATLPDFRRPLYITEAGIDNDNGGGWRAVGIAARDYRLIMESYCINTWIDGMVKAVFLYQSGALDPKWDSWEYAGEPEIEKLFRQGQIRKEIIMPNGEVDKWAGVGAGVRAEMEAAGDEPATVECWTGKEFSQTFGTPSGAMYVYSPMIGVRRFLPS